MKGRKLNSYAAALIVTVVGAGATLLIVRSADGAQTVDYSNIDSVLSTLKD